MLLLDSEEGIKELVFLSYELGIVNEILVSIKLCAKRLVFIAKLVKGLKVQRKSRKSLSDLGESPSERS